MRRYTSVIDDGHVSLEELAAHRSKPVRYSFSRNATLVYRFVSRADGRVHRTQHTANASGGEHPEDAFDLAWLNAARKPRYGQSQRESLRLADLFCGAGGLTLGILEAGRAAGIHVEPAIAADVDPAVKRAYQTNFDPYLFVDQPLEEVLNGDLQLEGGFDPAGEMTAAEETLRELVGRIDFAVGGPPCQGHSNLNNHTRRDDPKNLLYGRMARFARVFRPRHIIIENVHGAAHDRGGIMDKTREALHTLGYQTDTAIVRGEEVGVPQTRHRIFMVASLDRKPNIRVWSQLHAVEVPRTFDWAQTGLTEDGGVLDVRTQTKVETAERIAWLFDKNEFNLPNRLRPVCHQNDEHTYSAVYGRIHGARPAPTITTGFTVMGQGRFVHPRQRRTLTPREGARLQFFPKWFSFGEDPTMTRKELVSLIGNAVPPKMAYVLALELIR